MKKDQKIKVGMLRGGDGKYHDISLKRSKDIISCIFENLSDEYKYVDIFVDKDSVWHLNGIPLDIHELNKKVDIVWDLSRDPRLFSLLTSLVIPIVSNGNFPKILENDTGMLNKHIKDLGIKMPRSIISPKNAREVFEKFPAPWIVKNDNEIKLIKTFNELRETMEEKGNVVIEEFISGKIASVHSISGFRGEDVYVFPLVNTFDVFSSHEKEELNFLVKKLHNHLGIKHYLKSDFVLHPRNGFFLLGIDLLLDPRKESHLNKSCESVGAKIQHVFKHILEKTLNKK